MRRHIFHGFTSSATFPFGCSLRSFSSPTTSGSTGFIASSIAIACYGVRTRQLTHHSTWNWLAGSRSHALEILIAQTIEFAPIFLLGAAPEIPLLKGMIDAVWGMFNHSNIRVRMGWLLYVFNGPELHRWHHDLRAPRGGVNLATKFALWDWLWGTAYLPADIPAGQYGLRNSAEFPHGNYFKQFTFAFRKDTRRAAGNAWGNSPTRTPGKL